MGSDYTFGDADVRIGDVKTMLFNVLQTFVGIDPRPWLSIPAHTSKRWMLPNLARDIVMATCLRGDGHRFELHALVVMPDHVHLVLTPRWDERGSFSIREIMQEIKSVSAHCISKETGHVGRVWQEESFDRALRREEDLGAKIRYMVNNPVRARLVSTPAEYRWTWIESSELGRTGGAPVPPSQWVV